MNMRTLLVTVLAGLSIAGCASTNAPSMLLEAEKASAKGGGDFLEKDDRPGSSGKLALAGWDDEGQWLEWKFDIAQPGEYAVTVRYAGGRSWVVWRELKIDGKVPAANFAKLELPATGGWGRSAREWRNLTLGTLKLDKGSHVLRLTNIGGKGANGSANIDAVVVHSPGADPAAALKP